MKLGETIDTAYMIEDSSSISRILEKHYGDKPDDWMITNEMAVMHEGVHYSKIQISTSKGIEMVWFRHPAVTTVG